MSENVEQLTEEEIDQLHAKLRRARDPFDEAHNKVKELAARFQSLADNFFEQRTHNSRTVQPKYVPGVSTWADDIPTSEETKEALVQRYEARQALVEAYYALPLNERRHVAQLPHAAGER